MQQITRRAILGKRFGDLTLGKRFGDLTRSPFGGGMSRDVEMNGMTPLMGQDDENI